MATVAAANGGVVAIDLKPLAPPPSPPPQQKLAQLLPPPAFDDLDDDLDDGLLDNGGCDGGGRPRIGHRVPLPAPPPPFQRQSAGRCSVQQPMIGGGHYRTAATHYSDGGVVSEYFIPRSASAHDLCSAIEMQKIPPPLPPSALRTTAATLARPPRVTAARDKMVTFEDEKHHQQQHHRSSGDLIV